MSLNNKNERAHDLAREAARVRAKMEKVAELVAEYADDPGDSGRRVRRVEDLYDATVGLPR